MLPPSLLLFILLSPLPLSHAVPRPVPAPDIGALLSSINQQISRAIPIGTIPSSLAAPIPGGGDTGSGGGGGENVTTSTISVTTTTTSTGPAVTTTVRRVVRNPKVVLNPKHTAAAATVKMGKSKKREVVFEHRGRDPRQFLAELRERKRRQIIELLRAEGRSIVEDEGRNLAGTEWESDSEGAEGQRREKRAVQAKRISNPKETSSPTVRPPTRTTVTVTEVSVTGVPSGFSSIPIKILNPKYVPNPKLSLVTTYIAKPIYTLTTTHPGEPRTFTKTVVLTSTFGAKQRRR
ncbi:hypothetical protein T439DRAFT_383026 [Meredithblackwellia eburnea MCA 4105]